MDPDSAEDLSRLRRAFTHAPDPHAQKRPSLSFYEGPGKLEAYDDFPGRDPLSASNAGVRERHRVVAGGVEDRTVEDRTIVVGRFYWTSEHEGLVPLDEAEEARVRNTGKPMRLRWSRRMWVAYTRTGDRGPLIAMHHGVPTNRRQKWPLQEALARFCRTIAFDFLGMGESQMPRLYGKRDRVREVLDGGGYVVGATFDPARLGEFEAWHWREDVRYVDALMQSLYAGQLFVYESDDWGSGPGTTYAAEHDGRLNATVLTDPIAFDGHPVKEIEAIGRLALVPDDPMQPGNAFQLLVGAFDQTLWQIYKTMVHRQDEVYDQYTLRDIIFPYAWVDYENADTQPAIHPAQPASSTTMGLRTHAIHVLADRSSILSPKLLLPLDPKTGIGVNYLRVTKPVLVMWGENDNMMPAAQGTARFANAMRNAQVQVHYVPRAGHFAATDQPEFVAETIISFLRQHRATVDALAQPFVGLFVPRWKGDERLLVRDLW